MAIVAGELCDAVSDDDAMAPTGTHIHADPRQRAGSSEEVLITAT